MANVAEQLEWNAGVNVYRFEIDVGFESAQVFTPVETDSAGRVSLYLRRIDNGWIGNFRLTVREGIPGEFGTLLAEIDFNSSAIPTSYSWVNFSFTTTEFTGGSSYSWKFLKLGSSGTSIIATPKIELAFQFGGNVYAGGPRYRKNLASAWTSHPDDDHTFIVGPRLPNKPTNVEPTDTDTGIILLPTLSWEAG